MIVVGTTPSSPSVKKMMMLLVTYRLERCNTDLECSSFCCNPSSQVCSVHTNTSSEQVLCSKPPEASCISKEFCRKENIVNCFIVTTGVDPLGNPECALRCYNMLPMEIALTINVVLLTACYSCI